MRRSFSLLLFAVLSFGVLSGGSLSAGSPVSAATTIALTTTCGNSMDNTPGLGVICEVTVENTITALGGVSEVTVRECHGAAGDPEAACATATQTLLAPVSTVNQCNDSQNGGGATVRCSVEVTNTFVGADPNETDVSVNQCVGSAEGEVHGVLKFVCSPFPATTTGATITQCNGSANGLTLVEMKCTATGTESAALPITINQCNDSANGGGALVICSANVLTVFQAAPPTAAPTDAPAAPVATAAPSGNLTAGLTPPPSDSGPVTSSPITSGSIWALLLVAVALGGAVGAAAHRRRISLRK